MRRTRKNTNTPHMVNRKMDDETFAMRKQVMTFVREASDVIGVRLPRVEVRIADPVNRSTLGCARMGDRVIWISPFSCKEGGLHLRHCVFHELGHAIFNKRHTTHGLMAPVLKSTSKFTQDTDFRAMATIHNMDEWAAA